VAVDQRKLIAVMREAVASVEGRYLGYRDDLFDYVAQVVMLEREHERKATQIQKKIGDRVAALGTLLDKKAQPSS
jgi:hypothetical protein